MCYDIRGSDHSILRVLTVGIFKQQPGRDICGGSKSKRLQSNNETKPKGVPLGNIALVHQSTPQRLRRSVKFIVEFDKTRFPVRIAVKAHWWGFRGRDILEGFLLG
jgi:hypothetical protein